MTLCLLFQDSQDVEVFEAPFDHLRVTNGLLQDVTEAVDHSPDQAWRPEHIK